MQSTISHQSQGTAVAPLPDSHFRFLVCSKCRKDYTSTEAFYLTACTHSLCSTCLWPPPEPVPPNPHSAVIVCPACSFEGRIMRLREGDELPPGIAYCFRPIRELLDELAVASEFQNGSLKEQVLWLKDRVLKQKAVLNKIKGELQKSKEIKSRNIALEKESASLKDQLVQAQYALDVRGANGAHDLGGAGFSDGRYAVGIDHHDGARKRRASDNPSHEHSLSRPTSRNRQAPGLVQPHRLSLSPNHAAQHSERQYQANLQRSESGDSGHHRNASPNDNAHASVRDRLGEFVYDPNAQSRPSPPSLQHQQHQYHQQHQQQPQHQRVAIPSPLRRYSPPARPATADPYHRPQQYPNNSNAVFDNPFAYNVDHLATSGGDGRSASVASGYLPPPSPRFVAAAGGSSQRIPFIAPVASTPSRGISAMPISSRPHSSHRQPTPVSNVLPSSLNRFQSTSVRHSFVPHPSAQPPSRPSSAFSYRQPPPPQQQQQYSRPTKLLPRLGSTRTSNAMNGGSGGFVSAASMRRD